MDDNTAHDLAGNEDSIMVACNHPQHTGWLVCYQARVAIVDEEHDFVTHLPAFISDENEAELYLKRLNNVFDEGVMAGKREIRYDFRTLMGCEEFGNPSSLVREHEKYNHPETQRR